MLQHWADSTEILLVEEDSPGDVRLTRKSSKTANAQQLERGKMASIGISRSGKNQYRAANQCCLNLPKKRWAGGLAEIKTDRQLAAHPIVVLLPKRRKIS